MTQKQLVLLAAAGSAALMMGALGFQYIGELPPCKLCYWQRYPHIAAIAIGALFAFIGARILIALGAVAAFATGAVGIYHTGVEQGWWEGPTTCTSGSIEGMSTDDLLNQIMGAPLIRCDEIAWQFMGLSMASWNAVISFGLMAIWIMAYRKSA